MSVELEPTELGFKRPFSQEVSQTLKLYNPHHQPVAFKVKTTAPKQYCVRPNSGKIDPNETVEVQVLLQAMKEDPPLDARCKDKFLVQSVAISASDDVSNVAAVWQQIEQTAKSSIQEKKIRVNFLPAGSAATNGASHEEAPPAYSTRNIEPVTPSKGGDVDKSFAESNETAQTPAQQSTVGAAVAAVTNNVPTSQEDLKRQLDAANAKISQLQQQAADGLRQRKTAVEGNEKISAAATTIQQNAPGGVSVAIVALLCFISFLLAYFLF